MIEPPNVGPGATAGPLTGLRVVALEQAVAAPLCSRHLADLGADVTKVERSGGDFARHYDSVVVGMSAYFVWLNHGKQSVALDLSRADDRHAFDLLLGEADVFIHNLGPGAVARLGYGWDDVHARWPGIIVCAISGFGSDGPYRSRGNEARLSDRAQIGHVHAIGETVEAVRCDLHGFADAARAVSGSRNSVGERSDVGDFVLATDERGPL